MRLTGKAKREFESWYVGKSIKSFTLKYVQTVCETLGGFIFGKLKMFYVSPESMQWGIYQDWADSRQCLIEVSLVDDFNSWTYDILFPDTMGGFFSVVENLVEFKTRQEARNAAIEKFGEIINDKTENTEKE